jgi:hypothetical protein
MLAVCRRHHRFVHELGWRLVWGDEGEILAIKPDFGRHRSLNGLAPPLVS